MKHVVYDIGNGIRKPSVEFKAMSFGSILFTGDHFVNIKYLVEAVGAWESDSGLDNTYVD